MFRTILVPLDGSPLAEQALAYAERLAEATAAQLVLHRVIPINVIESAEDDLALAGEARTYLERIAGQLTTQGRSVRTITEWGQPAQCILERVRSEQADLVVIGTHGRSGPGRWLYGSVADEVLRVSPVPVILVSPAAATPWPSGRLNRILVPLDESDLAESALARAEELASSPGSEILLMEVVPFPPYSLYDNGAAMAAFDIDKELATAGSYVARIAARLKAKGVQVRTRVELAHPTMSIAEIAASESVDLIVMATHGRSGFARLVLGSVATGTLQHTRVPLMLIGPAVLQATPAQPATASATAAPAG